MNKSNQCSLEIADHLSRGEYDWCPEAETRLREQHDRIKELEARPVKEQLTDGELEVIRKKAWKLADDATGNCMSYSLEFQVIYDREFARAILRKASEK